MKLSIQDLALVHKDVYEARSKWYNLGLQLRVPPATLDSIESEKHAPDASLRKALAVWLRGVDPWPTWNCMTEALKSPTVGELQLAVLLERKYCDYGHIEEAQSQARKSSRRRKKPMCKFFYYHLI